MRKRGRIMNSLEEKFIKLGAEFAPGQEVRQNTNDIKLRGEKISGTPVDFSHGDGAVAQMSALGGKANPIPQGKYVPASRFGNLIYTAGMTPRNNGKLIQSGKVSVDQPVGTYKAAVRQAVANALIAAKNILTDQERVEQILALTVYINAEETFQAHSSLADFASEYLYEELGNAGIGSRAAIGVASLPGNAPVEIQLIAAVSSRI